LVTVIGQVREGHREIEVLIRWQAIESNKIFVSLDIRLKLDGGRRPGAVGGVVGIEVA